MTHDDLLKTLLDARLRLCAGLWPLLRDTHAVEDIFQVTLLRALKEAGNVRDAEHALAWARVTARHLAIDHLRKHGSRMVMLDKAALDALDAELDQRGDEALAARMDALKHCVERLPERSRRLVDLRYHENRDGQQVAEAMGLKLDAMYQAMRRVHLALRECVERRLKEA
jgi:RNA polymerase sigma-70 factor (ECF subfamily)